VKDNVEAGIFPQPDPAPKMGAVLPAGSVPPRPSAGGDADGPSGHYNQPWNRNVGFGSLTFTQIPDKSTYKNPPPTPPPLPRFTAYRHREWGIQLVALLGNQGIPRVDFLS
jgi:hypothetical protein